MKDPMQEATEAAISQDRKTIEYTTGLTPPKFETQQVYDLSDPEQPRKWLERNKDKATKERDKALAQASVRMLFSTDISKLDDAGVKGLYQSVTEGVWGMPDSEGAFFGKRGSKDDFRRNVELLRAFFKGNYALAEDEEAQRFRKMDWAEKFKYAREHESAGNALASIAGGERGASLGELVYLSAVAGSEGTMLPPPGGDPNREATKEISRKINYNTMTPEEKHNYEADVIGDYERKLAKREPLFTYVRMAADLSDEGAYILAKSYNENELDVPGVLGLPEDEQAKVMTTYAQMKGDLREGNLLWLIPTDFSTGTAGDRLQMGVYGLQQSVVSLGTDLYHLAEAGTMRLYAQMALDGKERKDFYTAWNTIERAKLYEKQDLPESDSFLGKAYQSFMENVHWIIPYGGAGKLAKWGKGANAAIHAADLSKELKTAGKLADLKLMMNVSLFSRMSPMADGMKYADETLNRLLTSVDKYTRELQELDRMRLAYGAGKGALDAAWVTARGSAFAAFAQEYLETADAAGVSREESVLTAVWVGLLNDRIEQLYVPGLESTLTKGQLKSLGMTALRRSFQEGTLGEYAKNFMTRYLTEGVRVGVTEGWIEEPLQQLVIEHGKAVDQVEGLDEKLKTLLKFSAKDVQTYLETAVEMLPASVGFGVTTVPGQLMRRRIRNRWNAHKTGLVNYDEGIVGLYQREIDVKKLIEASWQGKGEEEAEKQDKATEPQPEKPSIAGRKPKKGKRGIAGAIRAAAKRGEEPQPEAQPEEPAPAEPQLSEEQTEEQADLQADYRATDALTRAREIHEAHQGGDVCAEIAQELGLDVKTAEAVVQLLDEEAEVMRFDPRARSMVDQFFSGVRINEDTIATLLPGYVAGSFEADEENGVYVAKVKVGEDGGIAAGTKTIVYRRRDGVFFNPDGTLNEAELARAASRNSTLGKSYNQRIEQSGGNGLRWEELSDADRRREALILVNGRTDMAGAIAFRKKDGSEVTVRADAIINLATGRLADIGYGMGAKQATVRHETFHALWRFARELVKPEEVKKIADALAIDTKQEGWEDALDEKMAHQMEQYASGHYVMNAVSSRFEAFQAWAAKVFGGVDANRVLDTLPKDRQTQLGTILGEGTPFALEPFYDAVMRGKIGSGEMGIDKIVVPAKQEKQAAKDEDELPVEGVKDEPKPDEPKPEAKPEEPEPAEPAKPTNTMTRPAWDKGTHVVKRVERKDYKLHCRLEVVNVFDGVRTSWDADFDQANQGREMDDQKVAEIAGNLDYSKGGRVMEFTGKGAMLVAPNMNVLDGNHHTQGIREGYRQGGEKADKFREDCLAEARERGLEVSDHAAEAPVIVCIIESVETEEGKPTPTIAEIASDTNETSQEELTSFAKAMKYAQVLIKKGLIPRFKIDPETGDIMDEDAKTVKDGMRADPVGIFVQETHAKDIVKNDRLTEQGQEILRASIIAALLGDTDAETVKNMLARQKTLDMENEQRALMRMAPGLMALVNDPAKKDYDLRPDLVEALLWYQEWRDHDEEARRKAGKTKADWRAKKPDGSLKEPAALGTTWENFKGDLFSKPGPAAQIIGDLFAAAQAQRSFKQDGETDTKAGMKRAQELIVRELEAYLENVYATNTDTADMFGDFTPPTKDAILQTQREKNARYSIAAKLDEERKAIEAKGGKLLLAHHGTDTRGFTVFEKSDDIGFFFAKSRKTAASYIRKGRRDDANRPGLPTLEDLTAYFNSEWSGRTPEEVAAMSYDEKVRAYLEETGDESGVYEVALRMTDPYEIDCGGRNWDSIFEIPASPDTIVYDRIEVDYNATKGTYKLRAKKYGDESFMEQESADFEEIRQAMLENFGGDFKDEAEKVKATDEDATFVLIDGRAETGAAGSMWAVNPVDGAEGWYVLPQTTRDIVGMAKEMGCDGVVLRNVLDNGGGIREADEDDIYVVMKPEQVKLVDGMTYADDGSIIPAEERFNWSKPDMRYSIALYHGTGADFREPSLAHVGEGTGVAAQGHGFYATDDYSWADFMGHQAHNAGFIDSIINRRYVYQYEYDGSTENLTHWVGPNPEAAERLMKVAKDEGLQVRESFFADPDHTTGQRMERFLELAKRPDGSKLTRTEMGELFVKAGIDGTQEYCGPGMYNTYVFYNVGKLKNVHKWHGKKQLYSVAYKPRPIAPEKVAEIVERFGVTDNIEESLWILPDGRMLKGEARTYNFGGRTVKSFGHDALTPYVMREVKMEKNEGKRIENAMRDIYASGFIRMTADSAGLYIAKRPTDEQFDALYDICEKAYQRMEADGLDEMFVDVEDEDFRTAFTVRYRRGTSARRMIEDLKAWYDEGIMPEGATAPRYSVGPLYTGSAADYDKPSIRKVGTGEGGQVYGWGLYASSVRGIAESYARADALRKNHYLRLSVDGKKTDTHDLPKALGRDICYAFQDCPSNVVGWLKARGKHEAAAYVVEHDVKQILDRQHVYEQTWWTNRKPGDESRLLKWYEPVNKERLAAVEAAYAREYGTSMYERYPDGGRMLESDYEKPEDFRKGVEANREAIKTDGDLYQYLASRMMGGPREASLFLARHGIDGVKYPANSFGKVTKDGNKTGWDYVSFTGRHLRVDHKWKDGNQLYSVGPLYTGSGADYDSPDIRKVGSGEGNQVFGWGLYATNRKYIAEDYAKQRAVEYGARIYLKGRELKAEGLDTEAEKFALEWLANSAGSVDAYGGPKGYALALAESLEANAAAYRKSSKFFEESHARKFEDAAKWLRDNADDFAVRSEGARMLYEQTWWTNREPGDESHLLEWYEPVDGKTVKTILDKLRKQTPIDIRISDLPSGAWQFSAMKKTPWGKMPDPLGAYFSDELTARDLYRLIADAVGPQAASESLYEIGIDGIKYPANSFGLGKTDGEKYGWNYVAFSDENLRIDHKWEDGEQRYSVARTWSDGNGNAHVTLHRIIPQKAHSESQMEGVRNQHELDLLLNKRGERLYRMTKEAAYANILEIGRIAVASDGTRSDFYEWAKDKSRPEMENEIRANITDKRVDAVIDRVRETGATSVVGVDDEGLDAELLERVVARGGFKKGAGERTAVVGLGTGTDIEFMKAVEGVVRAGGRAVGLVSLYRDGAAGNESIFPDDVMYTPRGTRLDPSRYGDLHDVLRVLAKRMGGPGGMSAADLKDVPGYDAVIEVFARTPKRELRRIVAKMPWRLAEMLTDFAETEAFVRIVRSKGTRMAREQLAADRHAIASRQAVPSELGVNPASGGRVINAGQLSTYKGERRHYVPDGDMFEAVSVDDWDFVTQHADVDPAGAVLVADRIIDGRLPDLIDGIVANAMRGPWINVVYPDKGNQDVLTSRLAYRVSEVLSGLGWFVRRSRVAVDVDYAGKATAKVSIKSVAGQLVYLDTVYDGATSVAAISALKPVMTEGRSVVFATLAVDGSDRFAISDEELVRKIETARNERTADNGGEEGRGEARAGGATGDLHGGWERVRAQLESGELRTGAQPLPGEGKGATGEGLRRVRLSGIYGSLTDALGYDVRKTTGAELEGLVSAIAGGVWPEGLDKMRLTKAAEPFGGFWDEPDFQERPAYQLVRFSTRLTRAKRIALLTPKSAIPQMEFDFYCDRKGITEQPKAEPPKEEPKGTEPPKEEPQPKAEPPRKGKRYKEAVEDANGYQKFIDQYRPLYEAAVRRGEWRGVLDFAEENHMPTASNVLKRYYREPEFSHELVGTKVASVEDVAAILMTVRSPFVESTKAIYLDRNRRILDAKILTIGQAGEAAIGRGIVSRNMPPKTAFVVFSHNHPSGDPSPSGPDRNLTMAIKKELKRFGVKMLDHIITDGDHFYSFNYQDLIPIDVERPKWETLPAKGNMGRRFSYHEELGKYIAAHLRDDGDCGHVIYLNRRMSVVGVRRIPSASAIRDKDYAAWAKIASEGAESAGSSYAFLDLGPVTLTKAEAKRILAVAGPWFGTKGVELEDALDGSAAMGGIRSLRTDLDDNWSAVAPNAEEIDNEDRFNYPRYSIASRKIDWEKEPDSLANVVLSTTVAHLTGQDKYPQKYLYFKAYRDRGLLDQVKPEVEKWANAKETHWFGTYLLAKYYGDLEAAKLIARHHMRDKKVNVIRDILKNGGLAKEGVVSEPSPVRWLYVRNDDGRRTNRIPEAYAGLLAETFGGTVDTGIVKVSDERNTGAKIRNRVGREFQFSGEPTKDAPYVIVDDVWTTGQTAVSLMEYLEKKGATVAAITTLAVASNGSRIKPTGNLIAGVLKKGHVDSVERAEEITGVDLRKATGSELQAYIVKGKKGQWGLESWFGSAAPVLGLDFKHKGEKKTRATRFDLFAHLTAEQRKHISTKPSQGVFAFSTAFPHLSEMGDDQLIAAAHAVKVATKYLGRKMSLPNYDAIMKDVRKAYPAMTDEDARVKTMTIQGDAVKLARKIREGLDKGVSESAILKALNDTMKPTFMGEMRNEARAGVKAGAYGAHAEEMLDKRLANTFDRAIRVQAGVDTDLFEEWAGVDFTETLWKVLHNAYAENQPAPRKPEPAIEDPEEGGGGSEGGEARDPNTYTVKELENPRTFAEYIRDLAGKYWKETKGIGKDADPWQNRIAVQFLRKTAQNVYTKLVNEITYSRSRDTAYRAIQKMDSIPTVAGLVSQMAYVGEIIHARHIREKKQELCEKLENLLKTAFGATGRFKVDKEELKRKVTAEMELRARYMRHAMWLTPDAASEEAGELSRALTAMATKYDEAERDLEQSRIYVETIRKLNILREFGGLKYKSVGEIEQALAWWEEQAAGSSAEIIKAFEDREERTKTAAAILAKAFFNPKMKHKIDKGFRQGMNNYLTAHMGFASLLQDMCRFASEKDRAEAYRIIEYLGREIQKAGDRSAAEMRRHGDDFHKAVEQIYGMPFKKVMAAMNREAPEFAPFMGTKGGQPIMPTKGRAMQLLVSLRQGARKDSNYYENVKHWKREGQAAQIADLLTPQDMNMLKWIGQWYEVNRQELSDVCEALFGIGVYSEAYNYFPVRMQLQKQGLEKVEGVAWTIFPKALTPRIRNLRDFDTETDIFALWASRMEEASQWKGHAKLGLELRGIFGRSELQEVVAANHGSRVNSLMLGFVTDILAGHGAYDRTTSGIEWWSDQIRGWTALCALGGNVGVTFKQTTSIPAFGFEIGLVKTARYTVSAFTPAGMEAMRRIFASEQRKTRWQVGNTEAVKNALAKSDASWFKRAMQASMITNKVGDIVPGLVVGQGIYRDCLARGMSEENAMAQTWMLIERTQQSGRMENQTSVQRRNRLGRMLYQFLTTQQQYLQYEVRAIRQAVADPSLKNAAQVTNTILLNHLILSSLYYWMGELYKAMLGSEPPKDQIADWVVSCLLGPFASLYVLGFCSKVTLDRFLKGSWTAHGEDMMPMESFIKRTIDDAGRVIEAVFEEEKTTDDLIEELARLAAGMNPVVRDIRKVKKNMEE